MSRERPTGHRTKQPINRTSLSDQCPLDTHKPGLEHPWPMDGALPTAPRCSRSSMT